MTATNNIKMTLLKSFTDHNKCECGGDITMTGEYYATVNPAYFVKCNKCEKCGTISVYPNKETNQDEVRYYPI